MNSSSKNWEEVIKKAEIKAAAEKIAEAEAEFDETAKDQLSTASAPDAKVEGELPAAVEIQGESAAETGVARPKETTELATKLAAAEALANKHWQQLLNARAEMENLRRRTERDIANAHKYAIDKMAGELLVVIDNLERCLDHKFEHKDGGLKSVYAGVELTVKMFLDVLQKFGIVQIDPRGEMFNPDFHTAMMVKEEAGAKTNSVLQVIQKGYMLKDRLLRPAMVVVAK